MWPDSFYLIILVPRGCVPHKHVPVWAASCNQSPIKWPGAPKHVLIVVVLVTCWHLHTFFASAEWSHVPYREYVVLTIGQHLGPTHERASSRTQCQYGPECLAPLWFFSEAPYCHCRCQRTPPWRSPHWYEQQWPDMYCSGWTQVSFFLSHTFTGESSLPDNTSPI